jgi:epoxyqueuosine reductase
MAWTPADREWIVQRALAAGFDLAGVASVPESASADAEQSEQRFSAWIAAGHAGEMEYLKREAPDGGLVRGDLRRAVPWARSVIVCAVDYNAAAPLSTDPAPRSAGWIARYAWSGRTDMAGSGEGAGSDYHDVLLLQLQAVERGLKQRFGTELQTRCYVDTGPLVERSYAERAGIGWTGKNTCILNQQKGSWLLLGVIITPLELPNGAWSLPAADRCGSCTRCIDACPTGALLPGRQMDASRCIAYLTIEKKGNIAEELRAPMGRQVFGCDICQDVCPWNSRSQNRNLAAANSLPARRELINPELAWLASLDGPSFNRWFRGSPLERTRRKRILRNVAIAMGNSGETGFLPQLEAWAAGDDPVLAEAAAWAANQIQQPGPPPLDQLPK